MGIKKVGKFLIRVLKKVGKQSAAHAPEIDIYCERFGSAYGGWNVATGLLDSRSVVYSFGVGEDATFDCALIERFGLLVYAFDPTPRSINWVKTNNLGSNFLFFDFGVADHDGDIDLYPPKDPSHVSHSIVRGEHVSDKFIRAPVRRINTIMEMLGHKKIDLIKMDVEGAEYAVLGDMLDCKIVPTQLLVEFHDRFTGITKDMTDDIVARIRTNGYRLFHVSDSGQELCFILRSECQNSQN